MAGWVIIVPILARSCKRNLQYSQLIWKSKSVAIFWSFKLLLFKKNYNFNIGRMFIFYMISSKFGYKLFFYVRKKSCQNSKTIFSNHFFWHPLLGIIWLKGSCHSQLFSMCVGACFGKFKDKFLSTPKVFYSLKS